METIHIQNCGKGTQKNYNITKIIFLFVKIELFCQIKIVLLPKIFYKRLEMNLILRTIL
jgi:hypothetical protein